MRRKLLERLNSDSYVDRNPVWMSDGRLLFASDRRGVFNVYRQSPSASSTIEQLTSSSWSLIPSSLSRDGTRLFLTQLSPHEDVMVVDEPDRRPQRLITLADTPEISPDGRWVAYQTPWSKSSTVPDQSEVFVQRLPIADGPRVQVSIDGGSRPAWSGDRSELFFFDRQGRLTTVAFHPTASGVSLGKLRALLQPKYLVDGGPSPALGRPYDVAADGRFIMIKDNMTNRAQQPGSSLVVVQNWIEELKRLMPR
jgi:Tol biopolymer transport system component